MHLKLHKKAFSAFHNHAFSTKTIWLSHLGNWANRHARNRPHPTLDNIMLGFTFGNGGSNFDKV